MRGPIYVVGPNPYVSCVKCAKRAICAGNKWAKCVLVLRGVCGMLSVYRYGGFVRFFRLVRRGGFAFACVWVGPGWYRLSPTLSFLDNFSPGGNFWDATPNCPTKEQHKRETAETDTK